MGRGGEHFALAVYLGAEELETYREILRNGDSLSLFDAAVIQKCLMASFDKMTNKLWPATYRIKINPSLSFPD
jgi:hypothetical protein